MKQLLIFVLSASSLLASDFYRATSFQSYSGLINIPNAEIIHEGSADLLYSNEVDEVGIDRTDYSSENYLLNLGFFDFMELSGRLSELCYKTGSCDYGTGDGSAGRYRDLSASAKIQLPFYNKYFPKIAVGMQDIGSASAHYEAKYIVASKQLYFLNTTLGYAWDSDRMSGLFYGVEAKVSDWLYFLAENDTQEYAAALRVVTPSTLYKYAQLHFTLKKAFSSESSNNSTYFMVGVQFHLDKDFAKNSKLRETLQQERVNKSDIVFKEEGNRIQTTIKKENTLLPSKIEDSDSLKELQQTLAAIGFENVNVGEKSTLLYVTYENSIFKTNELDAIGVILGNASSFATKYNKFMLEIKKSDQIVKTVEGDLKLCRAFYEEPTSMSAVAFANSLKFIESPSDVNFEGEVANSSRFKTKLELSPVVKSFVGTEYGNFDYLISLHSNIYWNLYSGLDFSISADIPFLESDDLKVPDGHFAQYNKGSQLKDILLHYRNNIYNIHNTLEVGQFQTDYVGFMYQGLFNYEKHTLKYKYFYGQHKYDKHWNNTPYEKEVALLKYSYFVADQDMFIQLQGGQYWNFDRGFDFSLKKFFGDSAVSLRFQSTTPQIVTEEKRDHFAGLELEIPLTPRRSYESKYLNLSGTGNFAYYLRTTIAREDGTNSLNPAAAIEPKTDFEIENYEFNRNRLNIEYMKHHMSRLVDAYREYGVK